MQSAGTSYFLTHSTGKIYKTGVYRALLYTFVKLIFNYMLMGFTFRNWVEWGGVERPRRGGGFWGASPLVRSSSLKPEQNFNDSDTGKYLKRPDKQMSTVWSGRVCGVCARACARACMHIQWKESFINFFPFLSQNYKSLTLFWQLMYYFWDKILCSSRLTLSSGWSWTSYLLASTSQTVGEQVCPATPTVRGGGRGTGPRTLYTLGKNSIT